jgi:hypothetical protein
VEYISRKVKVTQKDGGLLEYSDWRILFLWHQQKNRRSVPVYGSFARRPV